MRSKKRKPPRRQYPDPRSLPRIPIYLPGAARFSLRQYGVCDACIERYEATASAEGERIGWCGTFSLRVKCLHSDCGGAMQQWYDDWQARLDARSKRLGMK
jgi:hypothetical protein